MKYAWSDGKRIDTVFRMKIPDRVPNFEILVDNPTFSHIMERPMTASTLGNIPPEDYLEFAEKTGQDVIGICLYFSPYYYEDDQGQIKPIDFRIKNRNDFRRIVKPDISWIDDELTLLDQYVNALKDKNTGLFVLLGSFLTSAYDRIFGFENFMYTLFDDLQLIEEVLEMGANYYVEITKKVLERNLTFLFVGDDIAFKSTTLIDPNLLRKIWLPRLQRIFEPAIKSNTPILFHSDGNIIEMIPDLINSGINALNPIEPYGMEIDQIKREFGRDIALVGNLDVGGNLSRGSTEDVRREAESLIDRIGTDGGLVLASSHSITKNVKPENFLAMIDTAHTYGRYK